jgi:enoyl-CoA hydratase/carnithine racemase
MTPVSALTQATYTVANGVATITLNRPDSRNALTNTLVLELTDAFMATHGDASVRAVVLTGAGDQSFCAGADLNEFADVAGSPRSPLMELFLVMRDLRVPTIAAVNGFCLAAGFGLALSCDLIIASDRAQFGTPEINIGIWPMMVMAQVSRAIGAKRAMELFLTAEKLPADQAVAWGLANRVVPHAELQQRAGQLAAFIASKSPVSMEAGRAAFAAIDGMEYGQAIEYLQGRLLDVAGSEDAREGMQAFLEKREPKFQGR